MKCRNLQRKCAAIKMRILCRKPWWGGDLERQRGKPYQVVKIDCGSNDPSCKSLACSNTVILDTFHIPNKSI